MISKVDVIVVGGGHAGAEAAVAAARCGARVLLVTSALETIGQMSCNPAIGGVAKGTVVREVDALGGVMGRAADRSTLQFRMLNRSKGPAVWSPRAQCDRGLYRRAVRQLIEAHENVSTVQATVRALRLSGDQITGVETNDGRVFESASVVVTAGTFLRGRIHIGTDVRIGAGRAGEAPVVEMAEQLEAMGLRVDRFKTGTPPRVDGRTVDYTRVERQEGDDDAYRFGQYERSDRPSQLPCWITWAGEELKDIIRRDLKASALYGGALAGRGPRYCPSIEDKIVKFPDAERHQIFLEPEGLDTSELYVNGLSTSLPVATQEQFLRAVPGLESARMTRAGYAIEYDYYPPDQLTPWLEVKAVTGLFFAGQINGTTGYEEAAGQGAVAGINAARRSLGREPVVLPRDSSYVGVLVDDLVSKGVDEPYRLFTSRSEYRLLLRQDNSLRRLGPIAEELGMLSDGERSVLTARCEAEEGVMSAAHETRLRPEMANPYLMGLDEAEIREGQTIADLVKRPKAGLRDLFSLVEAAPPAEDDVWTAAEVELKYAGYLARERDAARKLAAMSEFRIPADLRYESLASLSFEARQKLGRIQPDSLAQAGRIPGVSPSDLQNLVLEVLKRSKSPAEPVP